MVRSRWAAMVFCSTGWSKWRASIDTLFDRLAEHHQLDIALMDGLAEAIVRLHASAEPRTDRGGRNGMAWVVEGNWLAFTEQGATVLEPSACVGLTTNARAALVRCERLLEHRRKHGSVRWCHGDLQPSQDLPHRRYPYTVRRGAICGLTPMRSLTSTSPGPSTWKDCCCCRCSYLVAPPYGRRRASRQHRFNRMKKFLSLPPARLIAVGRFSGSGKSTLARRLGPDVGAAPGALILSRVTAIFQRPR